MSRRGGAIAQTVGEALTMGRESNVCAGVCSLRDMVGSGGVGGGRGRFVDGVVVFIVGHGCGLAA